MKKRGPNPDRGAAMFLILWMLILLAIFTTAISRRTMQELMVGRWSRDQTLSRYLINAGIERALLELQSDPYLTFEALNDPWASNPEAFQEIELSGGTFSVVCDPESGREKEALEAYEAKQTDRSVSLRYGVCDESARVNLNKADVSILTRLLQAAVSDLQAQDAEKIAQAIVDWRDPDEEVTGGGAEGSYYRILPAPYAIRNGPFESVEELRMVRGVTQKIYSAVEPYVTVYTREGKINFNTASRVVLQALGLEPGLAQRVVEYRNGSDRTSGTEDDQTFQVPEGITPALSAQGDFSGEAFAQISNAVAAGGVDVKSDTFRIHSIGRLIRNGRKVDSWVTCVVRREGTVLSWREGER